jgi:prefoldin beta subunit
MMEQFQEKINQIQIIQQNMQNFAVQRQQFQIQQTEIESALSEMKNSGTAYKIIGNVMVLVEKNNLEKDLEEKKKMLDIRISTIEKQEGKLREKAESLQKDVLAEIEKNKGKDHESKS